MNLSPTTGKFINDATAAIANRPMFTHAEISQKHIPGLPLDEGEGVIAATDGFRMHISIVTLDGAMGVVGLAKAGKGRIGFGWATIPPSEATEGLRYPDYCACIPIHNLTTAPLLDWPTINETTAKGLAKAEVWGTFKADHEGTQIRFTGFHKFNSYSLKNETAFGAVMLNPLYVQQAIAGMTDRLYMAFDTDRTGMRPVKIFSDNGNLAVLMAAQPPSK